MANKNSTYIGALTSFILDTKPFRCKLTEVQEIYQFFDEMSVHFTERLFSTVMTKAAWPYSYFSGGVPESIPGVGQPMTLHQLVSPLVRGHARNSDPLECRGAFKAYRDENTDLPLVPFAFDPHQIQGIGLSDAFIQRNGSINLNEPLVEGLDIFLSKGAYVFQIKQTVSSQPIVVGQYNQTWEVPVGPPGMMTPVYPVHVDLQFTNADSLLIIGPAVQVTLSSISVTGPGEVIVTGFSTSPNYLPEFTPRAQENVLATATSNIQTQALDLSNPNSAVNKLKAIMTAIAQQLSVTPNTAASAELLLIQNILNTPALPASYDALLAALASTPVIPGYAGWIGQDLNFPYTDKYVNEALSALSPGLYFNMHTDVRNRESGLLAYDTVIQNGITVSNIACNPIHAHYEEWTLTAVDTTVFMVQGSASGTIGHVAIGTNFNSTRLAFTLAGPASVPVGTTVQLTPAAKITVHYQAPLEAWSVIKTNPMGYTRPVFTSTRYGYLRSLTSELNTITVLDTGIPSTTITLTATSGTTFTVTSSAEPAYSGTAAVNTVFNDGRIAFTVVKGSAYQFNPGDKFYIEIKNDDPTVEDLDLYYGYDFDSYDADTMVYNTVDSALNDYLRALDFGYDSRFVGYDLSTFNLQIQPFAIPDRQWRLRALPNLSLPVQLHPVTAPATAVNQVSVIATNDPTNPLAVLQVDMANDTAGGQWTATDPDTVADLSLWYATEFALEYNNAGAWTLVDTVPVNTPYSNALHGVSFTICEAGKPFIAASLTSSFYTDTTTIANETLAGGDVIAWTVRNNPPYAESAPLVSRHAPRLIMYGDSYQSSVPAIWTLTFTGLNTYALQGSYVGGALNGQPVLATPDIVNTATVGRAYKNDVHGLHFTVVPGQAGLTLGDSFSFATLDRKPTFLVYGSVSGWQPDAVVDEWYWNGKIGFKIKAPVVEVFDSVSRLLVDGVIGVNYISPSAPTAVYRAVSVIDGHWMLYRNGAVVADGDTVLKDQHLMLTMPAAVAGTEYVIKVQGLTLPLSLGNDLAIVRTSPGRAPTANDFILIERTESDAISISIKPKDVAHKEVLTSLGPVNTDLRFVSHSTLSTPLANTSPETAVLQGWLPVLETRFDRGLSQAEFSDAQTHVVVRAAATGEKIGDVLSLDALNPAEPVIFRWDPAFHSKYLPLNTEATIVTLGSGMDDRVNVNMTDTALFLLDGGALAGNAMFTETLNIDITDKSFMEIDTLYTESSNITVSDGPFTGFLPGYDNLPYDFETGTGNVNDENNAAGYYDVGVPFTDYFQQAQGLAGLTTLTAPQQALFNDLTSILAPWLTNGDVLTTTLTEFLTNIGANPPSPALYSAINWAPVSDFGVPAQGMGMQVETASTNTVSTSVVDAASVLAVDYGYPFNFTGFNLGPLDTSNEYTLMVFAAGVPPIPAAGLSGLTTYAALETPLIIFAPGARIIEVEFGEPVPVMPTFYIWRPTDAAPSLVSVLTRVSPRRFRFSLAAPSELKLIIV